MDQGNRKFASALLAAAALTTAAATSAHATFLPTASYAESGDAGQNLATAQNAGAFPGGASTISGTIGGANGAADADLYSFTLAATTSLQFAVTSTAGIDTALFLLDSTGRALLSNNDGSGTSLNPLLNAANLAAGTYYLGIALSGNEPINSSNQLLFASDNGNTTTTRGPASGVNPATLSNFNSNYGFAETGPYSIALTAVPEPSTTAALAVGALGALVLVRRVRRQQVA